MKRVVLAVYIELNLSYWTAGKFCHGARRMLHFDALISTDCAKKL
jgi:hypothetical protein